MGIINTGTSRNINLVGDRLTLSLKSPDGTETTFAMEGVQQSIVTGGSGGNGTGNEITIEPIQVESAGKGLKFLPPFRTQPVLLGIDKQDSFYPLWQGSPIQVFQWDREPHSNRDGAKWKGEFDPSDKGAILLYPTAERPWFTFSTKSASTGTWDTARVELKEERELAFHDFEEPVESWQYEETASPSPTPTPSTGPSPTPAPTSSLITGWMPSSDWEIEATATHYQTAELVSTGSLSSVIDGNEATYWSSPRLSEYDIAVIIDLGQSVDIQKLGISSGDIPHRARGSIQTSDDGLDFTGIGFFDFLNGEINIGQAKRFIRLQVGQNNNAAYDEWHLNELFLYGTYDSNLVSATPAPTPAPSPVPTPEPSPTPTPTPTPTALENLNAIIWLKDGELTNHGSAGGTFSNNNVPAGTTLNNISVFNFSSGYLSLAGVDFQSPEKMSAFALLRFTSNHQYHGVVDFPGILAYEITEDDSRKASILRRDNGQRTANAPEVKSNPINEWTLIGWEIDFINHQVRFFSGGEFSPLLSLSLPSLFTSECIVGYYHPNQGGYVKGDLAELVIFHGVLPADVTEVKAELNAKWGLTLP